MELQQDQICFDPISPARSEAPQTNTTRLRGTPKRGGEGEGMLTHVPTASHRPSILSPWKSIPEQQTPRQTSFRLSHAANLFTLNHAKQVRECVCGGWGGGGLHAQVHWPSMGIHLSTNSPSSMKRVLREEPLGENTNGKGVRSLTGRKKIGKKKK